MKYIKISICNIVYRGILAMPLRFECCKSYVRLHNLTGAVEYPICNKSPHSFE